MPPPPPSEHLPRNARPCGKTFSLPVAVGSDRAAVNRTELPSRNAKRDVGSGPVRICVISMRPRSMWC